MTYSLSRRFFAEGLGTGLLVATVVGSGIMADALSSDDAVSLLGNTLPTGAILIVLITILGPVSGAHFNPAVSLIFALRRELTIGQLFGYVIAQLLGGVLGTLAAHGMFDLELIQTSEKIRSGNPQWFSEIVATFGLVATILGTSQFRPKSVAVMVGLYITAAYWFTASTSFANPAVAVARSLTNTFSGIQPIDVPGFILSELLGAVIAMLVMGWLVASSSKKRARKI